MNNQIIFRITIARIRPRLACVGSKNIIGVMKIRRISDQVSRYVTQNFKGELTTLVFDRL